MLLTTALLACATSMSSDKVTMDLDRRWITLLLSTWLMCCAGDTTASGRGDDPPFHGGGNTFDAAPEVAAGGSSPQRVDASISATAGASAGSGGQEPAPVGPPEVTSMSPESGPYGTVITVLGQDLGSAARAGVALLLGAQPDAPALFPDDDAVVSWSETEIRFRYPFPNSGAVTVATPQGSAPAGEFVPDWLAGPSIDVPAALSVVASVAPAPGVVAVAFDSDPMRILEIDAAGWTQTTLDTSNVLDGTLRLFADSGQLLAFGLSKDTPPELITFAVDQGQWQPTATGVTLSADVALAGGSNGAAAWFRNGDDWSRAHYSAGSWSIDKGPIADPKPSEPNHAVGATSDGSLYIAWDQGTGNFLDDTGAPFLRQLTANSSSFSDVIKAGDSVDDYVTSIALEDRGRGLLIHYCGSDIDPFGLSSTSYQCYTAALTSGGSHLRSGGNESDTKRYGVTTNQILLALCDDDGLHVTADPASPGSVAVWPCPQVDALELDPAGVSRPLIRVGDALYAPLATASRQTPVDAGITMDATVPDAGGD